VILDLATAERDGAAHAGRASVVIGAASDAIYLIHAPLVMTVGSLATSRLPPRWATIMLLATLGITSGVALHVALERPILRALRPRAHRVEATGMTGRSERIRTSGPCVPNTVLYQAELHSDRAAPYSGADPTRQGAVVRGRLTH
jgi:peptidoglycan/LPS O-acetylase OafA/YrhL